jgi:cytochrome d ubiquinol oxidase subunit II
MAYATFCSAFYLPVMALLVGFILRGISLEVRNSLPASWWHRFCDIMFCGGSCTITFMFGVALGNLIQGIALDETAEYAGSVEDLITPFPLLVGFLSLSMFALHGAVYGLLTTEQPIHNTISKRIPLLLGFFFSTYALTVTSAIILYPHIASTVASRPCVWCVGTVNLASMASLFYAVTANHLVWAFGASCMTVVSSFALYASTTFPILIRSLEHSALKSLTIFNAASSPEALKILLLYAIIGIPIVIIYSSFVHWIFHRKDPSHT